MSKILIADESAEHRVRIKHALSKIDKIDTSNEDNIKEVVSGIDLVPLIKSYDNFDYVVINPYMSLLDGADAIQILLNQGFLSGAKIVFLTDKALVHDIVTHPNVKGIIVKSKTMEGLYTKLESAFFTKYELLTEEQKKLLTIKIDYQKNLIKNIILKYFVQNKKTKDIQESDFMSELDSCFEDFELIPSNDIFPLAEEIIKHTCKVKNINITVDKHKLKFIFENREEVDTNVEFTVFVDKTNLKNLLQNKDLEEKDKNTLNEELSKELERYKDILDRYKKTMSTTQGFENFVKMFSNENIFHFHIFLIYIVLDSLKDIDSTIETNKLKLCIKDAKIMRRGVEILEYLRNNAKFYELDNETYKDFVAVYDEDFDLFNKFVNYQLFLILADEIKESVSVLNSFINMGINKITIGTLIDFFLYRTKHESNDFIKSETGKEIMSSMKALKVEYGKAKFNIVYLSQESIDGSEDLKYIQKIVDTKYSSYQLHHFSKNSVFNIWTNNKKNVDILIIDDNYELKQEKSVFDILNVNENLFVNTKIILLTHQGRKSEEVKELLHKASCFLKKPLDYEQICRAILTI
jgi:CheY-like chemotaxis protein